MNGSQKKIKQDCLFKFGVVSDIQYADIPDLPSFSGDQIRKYRSPLKSIKNTVKVFNDEFDSDPDKFKFVLQLGDIIDGQNAAKFGYLKQNNIEAQTDEAFSKVFNELDKLSPGLMCYHSIGNHELYNFNWDQLKQKLNVESKHQISVQDKFYFAIIPIDGWKVIQLNPYEHTLMQDHDLPGYKAARDLLKKENINFAGFIGEFEPEAPEIESWTGKQVNYFADMPDEKLYYCPFNGGMSRAQLDWLKDELAESFEKKEKVIVTTHIPITAESSCSKTRSKPFYLFS